MRGSTIFGILGMVFGGIGAVLVSLIGAIGGDLAVNSGLAFLAIILSFGGFYLSINNHRIAAVQYLISGLALIIAISAFGFGGIFFLLAAIFEFKDRNVALNVDDNK
jgi:hypothetical protein